MKKYAVYCLILCIAFLSVSLCSCTQDTSGYSYELTKSSWYSTLEGGAEVSLKFTSDHADLTIKNGEKTISINGKYIADDTTFVIFMPDIAQNYTFSYFPKGKTLDITRDGKTITLNKV